MRVYVSMNYIAPSEDHACTPIILSEIESGTRVLRPLL